MQCKNCQGLCIKKGCQNRRQKYYCKTCKLYQQKTYTYRRCTDEDDRVIVKLNNIGVGINGIARFTGMSKANVINRIKRIASVLKPIVPDEPNQSYEIDELRTYVQQKRTPCYITYAINRKTRQVIDYTIGSRTSEVVNRVVASVKGLNPKTIFTDRLNVYPNLIKPIKHITSCYKINRIERHNLTLRTHLKRLSRRTICFSKSRNMLENCLRIYFYANKTT